MRGSREAWGIGAVGLLTVALASGGGVRAAGDGVQVDTLTEELAGSVGGVAVDRLGFLYVADFGERVWKVTPHGEVSVLADSLYGASGNGVDAEGNLYQSSFYGNFVSRISRDGTIEKVAEGLSGPVGVAVDPDGHLFVCNCSSNSLSRISADGAVESFAESELFRCPNGITRGPDGVLYVVNFSDGSLLTVSTEGEVERLATIPGGGNGHVAFAAGELYVTGFRSNRVYRVSLEGEVESIAGTGAFSATDGPAAEATFASPNGIAYDPVRDVLYTNDFLVPLAQRNRVPSRSVVRALRFPSLTDRFVAALGSGGVEAATAAYREYRRTRPGRFTELEVNALGYGLLQNDQTAGAQRAFELNTEDYPASFNVWDSLGEVHKVQGNRERAIEFYRKSLELNPANTNAEQMLAELGVEP